jgi:hypothetical protein
MRRTLADTTIPINQQHLTPYWCFWYFGTSISVEDIYEDAETKHSVANTLKSQTRRALTARHDRERLLDGRGNNIGAFPA